LGFSNVWAEICKSEDDFFVTTFHCGGEYVDDFPLETWGSSQHLCLPEGISHSWISFKQLYQIPSLSWQSGQADQGLPRQRPAAVPQLNALAVQFFWGELTNGNGVFLQVEDFNSKTV